ncbi:MAG: hypothetical protein RG741_03305 [Bacteroidales bacterium]|nr:hypothetical protein [Bacteroidales bacterium]
MVLLPGGLHSHWISSPSMTFFSQMKSSGEMSYNNFPALKTEG